MWPCDGLCIIVSVKRGCPANEKLVRRNHAFRPIYNQGEKS